MDPEVEARFARMEAVLDHVTRSHEAALVRMKEADARLDRLEALMQKAEARMDRADARMDRFEARIAKSDTRFEKRMKGFEKLVLIGMKEIAELRRRDRETNEKLNALIDAQQRTDATLRTLIDSLRRGRNGR